MARTGINSWGIRSKIVLASAIALVFSTGAITVWAALNAQAKEEQDTRQGIVAQAQAHASRLQSRLDAALQQAKTLAQAFSAVKDEETMLDLPREAAIGILRIALSNDDHFLAIGTLWESDAYDEMDESYQDSPGHDDSGRFVPLWRQGAEGPELVANTDYQETVADNYYERCKSQQGPLLDALQNASGTNLPTARLLAPIGDGKNFYGAVRIDLGLEFASGLLANTGNASFFLDENGCVFANNGGDEQLFAALASEAVTSAIAAGQPTFCEVADKIVRLEPLGWAGDQTRWWSAVAIDQSALTAAADAMLWNGLLLGLLASGCAVALLWFLAGHIAMPVSASAERMQAIASKGGDLTSELPVLSGDEGGRVARAFNAFQQLLRDLVKDVQQTAQSLEDGTGGISSASEELSKLAQDAARSLHGATQQLSQFAGNVRTTSESAGQAKQHADTSVSLVDNGLANMRELQETMHSIVSDSTEIAQIVKVIDDIAFQTNLLALNAAVEAARAGDAGKGFAVVAEEVRSLALRSAESAHSTSEFVTSACKRAEDGARLSTDVDQMLSQVAGATREVQRLMGNINSATNEQSQSVEQVQRSVAQLGQISQSNAACAQQLAGSAHTNAGNAQDLSEIVGRFRI